MKNILLKIKTLHQKELDAWHKSSFLGKVYHLFCFIIVLVIFGGILIDIVQGMIS